MRDQASEAGITINVNVMPAAKYWEIWTETPFGGTAWTHRPLGTMALSLAYRTGVAWNETRYSNPEFEAALDEAEATLDVEARTAIMEKVEKIMQDDVPAIIPIFRPLYTAASKKVHNYPAAPDATITSSTRSGSRLDLSRHVAPAQPGATRSRLRKSGPTSRAGP